MSFRRKSRRVGETQEVNQEAVNWKAGPLGTASRFSGTFARRFVGTTPTAYPSAFRRALGPKTLQVTGA
jgi:hypothetical protein